MCIRDSGRTALIVVYSDFEARRLYEDLLLYTDKAHVFCEKEYVFYNIDARDHSREFERLSALDSIREGGIIIASVGACMSYTLPKAKLDTMCLEFHTGEEYDTDCLTRKLIDMGYRREDITEAAGQFSLRGGILDIFSPNSDSPVRIEFFDTEVDSIRYYDASTQRSLSQERECRIIPASELCLNSEERGRLLSFLEKTFKRKSCSGELKEVISAEIEQLESGLIFTAADKYVSVVYDELPTLCDYIDTEANVFIIEPKRINERAKTLEWEQGEVYHEDVYKRQCPGCGQSV